MILIENREGDSIVYVYPKGKLSAEDFKKLENKISYYITKYKYINLIVNGHEFKGWEDIKAVKMHYHFIKQHEKYIKNVAIVTKYFWQYFLAMIVRRFINVHLKVFKGNKMATAEKWIKNGG